MALMASRGEAYGLRRHGLRGFMAPLQSNGRHLGRPSRRLLAPRSAVGRGTLRCRGRRRSRGRRSASTPAGSIPVARTLGGAGRRKWLVQQDKLAQSVSPDSGVQGLLSNRTHYRSTPMVHTKLAMIRCLPCTGPEHSRLAGAQVGEILDRKGRHRLSSDRVGNFVSTDAHGQAATSP
jgi:hypothetical protein